MVNIRYLEAVSNLVATFLIIALMLVLIVATVYTFLVPVELLKDTPYLASEASVKKLDLSGGNTIDVLSLIPISGQEICIDGLSCSPGGKDLVSFHISGPSGTMNDVSYVGDSCINSVYGSSMYIYKRGNDVVLNTKCPPSEELKNIAPFEEGIWTLTMVDENDDIIIFSKEFTLSGGVNILAGSIWSNGTLIASDGTELTVTNYGTTETSGPGGMSASSFDGSSYIEVGDSDYIDLSGDMTISFWINPSVTAGYHNLLGKGEQDDNDNYDLFIIDREVWFEWNDASTGAHRHIKTSTVDLTADQWTYVTITVENSQASLYVDSTDYNYQYYTSNLVDAAPVSYTFPVSLTGNNQDLHIGKQDWGTGSITNAFFYEGEIGEIAFYDRALTEDEIAYNYNNYLV